VATTVTNDFGARPTQAHPTRFGLVAPDWRAIDRENAVRVLPQFEAER
jgi:hypothetical protein